MAFEKLMAFFQKKEPPAQKTITEIAEENRATYMEALKVLGWETLGAEVEMLPVYVDMAGNNYYVPRNIWQGISSDRRFALEEVMQALEFRQGRDSRILAAHERLILIQKGLNGDLQALRDAHKSQWEELEIMRKSPSEHTLMEYAVHIMYTDGEDPNSLSPAMLQMKRDRAAVDPGLRAFFLDAALATVNNSLPSLPQGGLDFSEEAAREAKRLKVEATRKRTQAFMENGNAKKS